MGRRFTQGNLNDGDVIACWLLSQDTAESFEKLIERRRHQVDEEIVQLREIVLPEISPKDWERMGRIYLTSRSENCSMKQAEEILTQLEQKRNAKPKGAYAKIVESLKTPSYGDVENSKKVEKLTDDESVEWVHAGTVKLESLKRKYRR